MSFSLLDLLPDSIEARIKAGIDSEAAVDELRAFVMARLPEQKTVVKVSRAVMLGLLREAYGAIPLLSPLRMVYPPEKFAAAVLDKIDDIFPQLQIEN